MGTFARIEDGTVVDMHVVADQVENGPELLETLYGFPQVAYVPTPQPSEPGYPGIGFTYDGTNFIPPTAPEVTP